MRSTTSPGTLPNGGTAGAGVLDVRNLSAPANGELVVQFDIRVEPALVDGTIVLNQAELISAGTGIALSDDPTINGQADPDVDGDEDPTRVLIQRAPPGSYRFEKTVATEFTREWDWEILKTAFKIDGSTAGEGADGFNGLIPGDIVQATWEVTVQTTGSTDYGWGVSGNIIITNPAPIGGLSWFGGTFVAN